MSYLCPFFPRFGDAATAAGHTGQTYIKQSVLFSTERVGLVWSEAEADGGGGGSETLTV